MTLRVSNAVKSLRLTAACLALLLGGTALAAPTSDMPSVNGSPIQGFSVELLDRPVGVQTVPFDMNEHGEAVGYYLDASLNYRAIHWSSAGEPRDLAGAGTWSQAHGIADNGFISGYYGPTLQSTEPVVWTATGVRVLGRSGVAEDVASTGRAVGEALRSGSFRIAFWQGTRAIAPSGQAVGSVANINEADMAVGSVLVDGFPRGAFWDARGRMTILAGIGGGSSETARAVSPSGRIVGSVFRDGRTRPVVWSGPRAVPTQLGEFDGLMGVAFDLNDSAWVVGADSSDGYDSETRALLWDERGVAFDLNTLIPAGSGWTLSQAVAVNNAGQILGAGFYSGASGRVAFRLTPVP
jgi:uncharacterized membrane protein